MLARRGLFDRAGIMDPSYGRADDREWFIRIADLGVVPWVVPDVLYSRRMHADSQSHTNPQLDPYFALIHRRISGGRARPDGQPALGEG